MVTWVIMNVKNQFKWSTDIKDLLDNYQLWLLTDFHHVFLLMCGSDPVAHITADCGTAPEEDEEPHPTVWTKP